MKFHILFLAILLLVTTQSASGYGIYFSKIPPDLISVQYQRNEYTLKYVVEPNLSGPFRLIIIEKLTGERYVSETVWSAGVEIQFNLMHELRLGFNIESRIFDTSRTLVDEDRGRYLSFSLQGFASDGGYVMVFTLTGTVLVWEDKEEEEAGIAGLPIDNYILFVSLILIAVIYRRKSFTFK